MAPALHLLWLTSVALAQVGVQNVDKPMTVHVIEVNTQYLTLDPSLFVGRIGVDTKYLTEDNSVTKWVGVNTEYITQITATTTDSQGSPVTSTQNVQAMVIGNPPVDGILDADLSIIVTPAFISEINSIKADLCPLRKRALTCGVDFVGKVAATFDIYAAAEGAKWGASVGGISAIGAMYAAQAKKIAETGREIPLKMDIKKDDFNKATPIITKIITTTKSRPATTISSSADSTSTGGAGKAGSTATVSPAECWSYTGSSPDTSNVENSDGDPAGLDDTGSPVKIKHLAGRITYDDSVFNLENESINVDMSRPKDPAIMMKRRVPIITHLGSCPNKLPKEFKLAPSYPSVTNIIDAKPNQGLPQELWWFIPQPYGNVNLCRVHTLQHVSRDKLQNNLPLGYDQTPASPAPKVSVDHIYERSFLPDFFKSVFKDEKDPRCKPFFDMFLQTTKYTDPLYPNKRKHSRLQTLFYLTPNRENMAFIGLERNLNSLKGALLDPGVGGMQTIQTGKDILATDKNLNLWNDIAMAWSVLMIPAVQSKFKQVNNDIYRGFLALDKLQSCEPIKGIGNSLFPQTWASAYQDWITTFFRERQDETVKYVASITSAIEAAPSSTTEPGGQSKNKYGRAFDALAAQFPEDFYQLDTAALFDFSGDSIDNIQKRELPEKSVIGFPACSTTNTALPTGMPKLSKDCVTSTMINCKWLYGEATNTADCPTTTVTTLPASCNTGRTTATPRPEFAQTCTPHNGKNIGFPRSQALKAISDACGPGPSALAGHNQHITMWTGVSIGMAYGYGETSILYWFRLEWSQDQGGCKERISSDISIDDCKRVFQSAIDNCDTHTIDEKYGAKPMVWSSPNGCIDVSIWAPARDPAVHQS